MSVLAPLVAGKTWRTLEPVHGMIYFAPEAAEGYARLGLEGRMGYFASRAAALGAVGAEPVVAMFFNFNPALVRRALPAAWGLATPAQVLDARTAGADLALRRSFGEALAAPDLVEAAGLARRAADAACARPEGRPLFAAHAVLPWPSPDDPHLVLWHAQTLLREFRGDAHVAALLLEGLSGVEALVSHAASGDAPAEVLRTSRAWPEDDWAAAVDGMRSRGLIAAGDDLAFTEEGRAQRARIEDRTDALSVSAYEPLGEDGCEHLRRLARPYSRAVVAGGGLEPR